MSEKIDPLKLSEQLEAQLGARMEQELAASKAPEALAQLEKPAAKAELSSADLGVETEKDRAEAPAAVAPEAPGASEKSLIDLTEMVGEQEKESKKDEIEAALAKAREEYVAAEAAMGKAEKGTSTLTAIRAKIKSFFGKGDAKTSEEYFVRAPEKRETVGGAQAEAQEAREKFIKAHENLKASIKAYRDEEVGKLDKKSGELKDAGKTDEEIKSVIEKSAKDILLATTLGEAAKIEDLKMDKQVEQMGKWRRNINESTERFANWYKELPLKYKFAVSGALFVAGGGLGAVGLASTAAAISFATAGQLGLRVIGGSMTTAGLERLLRNIEEKEEGKALSKEFGGKFSETLKNQDDQLNERLFKMVKNEQTRKNIRFAVAGVAGAVVGSGALAQMFKGIFSTQSVEGVKGAKGPVVPGVEKPSGAGVVDVGGPKGPGAPGVEGAPVEAEGVGKEAQEIINLPIGARGPEGAIIEAFKTDNQLAAAFGWDGKTDISKWAGTKAHQMWLASVEEELAKPGIAVKLTEQGFTVDAEGYAKAMHKIGKGFVEIDPTGDVHLTDNTTFLKAGVLPSEVPSGLKVSGGLLESINDPSVTFGERHILDSDVSGELAPPVAEEISPTVVKEDLLNIDELLDKRIKNTVNDLVEPAILIDKTFKAAAKIPLGKILEELKGMPPEAYKDKYALSQYWHSLSGLGLKTPDLPGTGFLGDLSYDDFRKYAEMTRLVQKNLGASAAEKLKKMTVEEFLKMYGGDLGKK